VQNLLRLALVAGILALSSVFAVGQSATPTPKPSPAPTLPKPEKLDVKNLTAEQAAELAIIAAGSRERLNQIRKTTFERGRISVTGADGKLESANYQRYVIRGENASKEKIRLDQDFPSARYSLLYVDDKIFGIFNNTVFTPREDASRSFENQIAHGIDALLRYRENGSTLTLASHEKVMGVDYYILDVVDKLQRKTRFYVSSKSFRVMMLDYEEAGVKYRRRFYDYNAAQGTLVPYRSVLWAGDKQVEEIEVGTITFGQKVDEGLFSQG
jgi:hypothetical protein